jgi:enamine deaminase RidA (YjgF/YER057c/UK114 family)
MSIPKESMAPKGCTFYDGRGFIKSIGEQQHYSQAVVLPNGIVKISGQAGCTEDGEFGATLEEQIELAYRNVESTLKAVGLRGWEDVYALKTYHVDFDAKAAEATVASSKKLFPDHRPIWTLIGVSKLGLDSMLIEVEVEAIKQ